MMARTPEAATALSTMSSVCPMSPLTIEPKPMYTGFSPSSRKRTSEGSGSYSHGSGSVQKPVMWMCSSHSGARGTSSGLMAYSTGILWPLM